MSLKTLEDEQAYINSVKRSNAWFAEGRVVKLTSEQVDTLLRAAYRGGYRSGAAEPRKDAPSVAEALFGKFSGK